MMLAMCRRSIFASSRNGQKASDKTLVKTCQDPSRVRNASYGGRSGRSPSASNSKAASRWCGNSDNARRRCAAVNRPNKFPLLTANTFVV